MIPPTIYELLEDKEYRAYLRMRVDVNENLALGFPWQLWAYKVNERGVLVWSGALATNYAEAWSRLVSYVRARTYVDIAIVSRRQLFPHKPNLVVGWEFTWCARCRRPSTFEEGPNHHALPRDGSGTVTGDEPYRCFYCGARQVFAGDLKRQEARP